MEFGVYGGGYKKQLT